MGIQLVIWSHINYCGRSFDQVSLIFFFLSYSFISFIFFYFFLFTVWWVGGMDGMGWDGMDGMGWYGRGIKCPSIFFILCGYIDHVFVYLYI